ALWMLSGVVFVVRRIGAIVREILRPERAAAERQSGRAPFVVALRKIRRMRGPGLLEAMRMRVLFEPGYGEGAPAEPLADPRRSELERDLDFLLVNARDRGTLRALAARVRRRLETWRSEGRPLVGALDGGGALAEEALCIAAAGDRQHVLTLLQAEAWLEQ